MSTLSSAAQAPKSATATSAATNAAGRADLDGDQRDRQRVEDRDGLVGVGFQEAE